MRRAALPLVGLLAVVALLSPLAAGCVPKDPPDHGPGITVEVTQGPDGPTLRQAESR